MIRPDCLLVSLKICITICSVKKGASLINNTGTLLKQDLLSGELCIPDSMACDSTVKAIYG